MPENSVSLQCKLKAAEMTHITRNSRIFCMSNAGFLNIHFLQLLERRRVQDKSGNPVYLVILSIYYSISGILGTPISGNPV